MTWRGPARPWLLAAAVAGGLHAAWSLYWAVGGRWLLPTVGQWAVRLAEDHPLQAGVALGGVALVKALAAALPLAWGSGALPWARAWGRLFWAGAVLLIGYGALNVVVSWAVLGGVVPTPGGIDRSAQLGHAALWDPLFLVWGVCLAVGLRRGAGAVRFVGRGPGH